MDKRCWVLEDERGLKAGQELEVIHKPTNAGVRRDGPRRGFFDSGIHTVKTNSCTKSGVIEPREDSVCSMVGVLGSMKDNIGLVSLRTVGWQASFGRSVEK